MSTTLKVHRDDEEIVERLILDVESAGQSLRELVVQTGKDDSRPTFLWSIGGENGLPSTSLPASDVQRGTAEESGTYRITVSDLNLRGRPLIARRRYPVADQVAMTLPSVPGAVSQQSEVQLGAGLVIKQRSRSVQRVPLIDVAEQESSSVVTGTSMIEPWPVSQRLRYDAVEQPSIVISSTNEDHLVNLAWRESIRVIASSRGTDRIEATYRLTASAPLTIEYPDDLQLISITRNDQPIDLRTVPQRPIRIEANDQPETLTVVWNRSRMGTRWVRECPMPTIKIAAIVLKSDYQLAPAADTFAPASLLSETTTATAGTSDVKSIRFIDVDPGEQVTLIRRNVALAIGWLIAIVAFAIAWIVASRSPLAIAVSIVVLTALTLLWWPWRLALIGWLIVPVIAAALLVSARAWTSRGSEFLTTEMDTADAACDHEASKDFSWAAIVRVWLLWIVFWSSGLSAMDVTAQSPLAPGSDPQRSDASVAPSDIGILVPMDSEGKMTGNIVYLPRSVHSRLFQTEGVNTVQSPNIQTADYRVRITPASNLSNSIDPASAGSATASINFGTGAIVEAEYLLHLTDGDRGSNQVRLPLAFASVRRVELLEDVDRIVRFSADSQGFVTASLPKGLTFRLRVTMLPTQTRSESWTRLRLTIPSVACSRVVIESEQNIDAVRVGGTRGRLLTETDLRRWVTPWGPSESLEIDYRVGGEVDAANSQPLRRRYWVSAGERQSIIECELDATVSIAAGETFQFVIRDAAMPVVTSPNWRLVGSELYSPTRRLVTMAATRDSAGPIRLLWTRDRLVELTDPADSESIVLPEVVAAALGENAPAWIAFHCDSGFRLAPIATDMTEPLSVDQFMAAWSGYRGLIDRAVVATDSLPTPQLRCDQVIESTVSQRHHLHVNNDQLELQYDATLVPGEQDHAIRRLAVPRSMELIRLSIDGVDVETAAVRNGEVNEYPLNAFASVDPIAISATAIQTLPKNMQFVPPRLRLLSPPITDDVYVITRDPSAELRELKPTSMSPIAAIPVASSDSLSKGRIQVANFQLTPEQSEWFTDSLDSRFQVKPRRTRYDCRQLIRLSREDARWRMESQLRFDGRQIPDFVDVEIPTRWCEQLEVSPAISWSRQPATDPLMQIIRIRCDVDELNQQPLMISGTLQNTEAGRVAVPNVRLLGLGNRRVHISVPNRLTSDAIEWRTSAVESVGVPELWQPAIANQANTSTYLAASSTWSIELAPLPTVNSEAVALTQDTQAFPQPDGMLVVSRWDLFPAGLESVAIQLPDGSEFLGAWSAGNSVAPKLVGDDSRTITDASSLTPARSKTVRVPLSLNRLSQAVEILLRLPAESVRKNAYIPRLLDVPVTQNWLSIHEPTTRPGAASDFLPDDDFELLESEQQRLISLARSTVESVEHAVDIIAERPVNEVAAWLVPWVQRYRQLAASAGHPSKLSSSALDLQTQSLLDDNASDADVTASIQNDSLLNGDRTDAEVAEQSRDLSGQPSDERARSSEAASRFGRIGPLANQSQWRLLDDRIAAYVDRYSVDTMSRPPLIFHAADFDGFHLRSVTQLSATSRLSAVRLTSTNDRGLRNLMLNLLTLTLVTGMLACMRPLRRFVMPVIVHPAFWLGVMGVFGFAVAPASVAAATILCAVALPVFPGKNDKQKSIRTFWRSRKQ